MAKIYKKYYTLDEGLTRFEKAIAIISFKKIDDLRKISKGDEMFMKVVKKLEELSSDPDMVELISTEKAIEFGHKLDVENAKKEGKKEQSIEIAQKLVEKNVDVDTIIESTGLSKEEIEKLKKNNTL